jgi:hypothetical protein
MRELCIEKFSGVSLPPTPVYTHIVHWPLVLEQMIPIRGTEDQIVITPADATAAEAAHAAGGAFWVYGYIAFLDLFGDRQERKYLFRWDSNSPPPGFIPDTRPDYV